MATLPPSSDFTGASVTEGGFKSAITLLRSYINDLFSDDSSNKAQARETLQVPISGTTAKTGTYTAVAADCGQVLNCTNTWTLTLTSAVTLGDGWNVAVANTGSGTITVNTSLSQLIDGATSTTVLAGQTKLIHCTGAQFVTVGGGSGAVTGTMSDYLGSTAPTGYVLASGRTIGSAASSGTERANDDCYALFKLLWDSMGNTEAAVSSGRGANADSDWAANKTITLPDLRGRVTAGKDNMGGTTASRMTSAGSGITGTTLGTSGGTETHTLTAGQSGLPLHGHALNNAIYTGGSGGGSSSSIPNWDGLALQSISNAGGTSASSAHPNVQPTLITNKIIKL
jgi:microcystin-dependent protein